MRQEGFYRARKALNDVLVLWIGRLERFGAAIAVAIAVHPSTQALHELRAIRCFAAALFACANPALGAQRPPVRCVVPAVDRAILFASQRNKI